MSDAPVRFKDMRTLVEATLKIFEGADGLAKTAAGSCYYGRRVNNVGCAIGCHFDPEVANSLDAFGGGVWTLFHDPKTKGTMEGKFELVPSDQDDSGYIPLEKVFVGSDLTISGLRFLQMSHDHSTDLDDFLSRLKHYLETGEVIINKGRFIHHVEETV